MDKNSIKIGFLKCSLILLAFLPNLQIRAGTPNLLKLDHILAAPPPTWTVNAKNFQFNMSLIVRVKYDGNFIAASPNLVGVFVGNELRGVATPIVSAGRMYFFITAYSNVYSGEPMHFQVYYQPDDKIYGTPETLVFQHNQFVGNFSAPFLANVNPNVILAVNNAPICSGNNLSLGILPTVNAGVTFAWSGPNSYTGTGQSPTAFAATASAAGVYTVTITKSNGQTSTATTTVSVNNSVTLAAANNGPLCFGDDLNLSATATNGSGIFSTFSWSGPANFGSSLKNPGAFPTTPASAGNYQVTVMDSKGCTATAATALTFHPLLTCPANISQSIDPNLCTAVVSYSVTPSVLCSIENSDLAQTAGLASGSVFPTGTTVNQFLATDGNGNTQACSFSVMVIENIPPTVTCPSSMTLNGHPITCSAVATFSVLKSDNCSTPSFATLGLPSGATFPNGTTLNKFRATDAVGNTAECSFTVTILGGTGGMTTAYSMINPTCFGGANGTIFTTVNSGTAPYTYLWSNAKNTKNINLLAAGSYILTITDAYGCYYSSTATLMQPPDISFAVDYVANAPGYHAIFATSGGTGGFVYNRTGMAATDFRVATDPIFDHLPANTTYIFKAKDANGCLKSVAKKTPATAPPTGARIKMIENLSGNLEAVDFVMERNAPEEEAIGMSIFPNPVSDILDVEFLSDKNINGKILITNLFGKAIFFKNVNFEGEAVFQIPVQELPMGWFVLIFRYDSGHSISERFYVIKN